MPTYSFACTVCGHRFDEVMSIHDSATPVCPDCGGQVRKVFDSVGVSFKGSGFYRTDSREKPASSSPSVPAAAPAAPTAPASSSGPSGSSSSD